MKNAKIVVLNFTGNVGKSTLAKYLFVPRLENAKLISIESINSTDEGVAEDLMRGKQFNDMMEAMTLYKSVVVDVGASNVEDFLDQMEMAEGSHEDFDFFVVPVVPEGKQIRDTISTINALAELGVPDNKILVVFNQMGKDDTVAGQFPGVVAYLEDEGSFTLKTGAVVKSSELFARMKGETMDSIMAENVDDLKKRNEVTEDPNEKLAIGHKISNRRLAEGVKKNFDQVFASLLG